jgi:hypothetical protein
MPAKTLVGPTGLHDLLVTWEAESHNGTVLKEREGRLYKDINRADLKEFRLVAPGEILLWVAMKDGRTGHDLCYRRRSDMSAAMGQGFVKNTWFMVGFAPMGPVYAYNPGTNEGMQAPRFIPNDPLFYPPEPHLNEGEMFNFDSLAHGADARLRPSRIKLPTGQMLDVR